MRLTPGAKTAIRLLTRRYGYDLVPFVSSFADLQQRNWAATDLLVDVGANVGQYAERARQLGYQGQILSFEPSRDAFRFLEKRTSRDDLWEARCVALGPVSGVQTLRITANGMSSSLRPPKLLHVDADAGVRVVDAYEVEVSTLDMELLDTAANRVWLKMDVQGYELDVLEGARRVLHRVAAVQAEMSFEPLYEDQALWLSLVSMLGESGFGLRHLEPGFVDPSSGFLQQADGLFLRS